MIEIKKQFFYYLVKFFSQYLNQTCFYFFLQQKFIIDFIQIAQKYMNSTYSCVNCRLNFDEEANYKLHYKSQHHRYNVKRRLIGMMPLSYDEYIVQFQSEICSKSSTQKQLHCQLCSKKFLSPQTYKQHLNSQKHKNNRKKLLDNSSKNSQCDEKSQTSSCSEFSVIGKQEQKKIQCLFCSSPYSKQHMKKVHNFPPFSEECTNLQELTSYARQQIKRGRCLYCSLTFQCQQSAKQHMMDTGHAKLDINKFGNYEKFYLWKIQQSQEQQTQFEDLNQSKTNICVQNKQKHYYEQFQNIKKQTLQSLQRKRLERIQPTTIGYMINGKQVGTRQYKQYYKQYLSRQIPQNPYRNQKSLGNGHDWKDGHNQKHILPCRVESIVNVTHNHR